MRNKYRIFLKEENINGCGDYADTAVDFDRKLAPEEVEVFQILLRRISKEAGEQDLCLDTDEMVQQALDEFQSSASGRIVPVADAFITF